MVESVFYNPKKAEEEAKVKKEKLSEQEKRKVYFKRLSTDKNFAKYILEEIINREIQSNKDISSSLSGFISASPEEVKSMIVGKAAALKSAENIKSSITDNF